MPICAIINKIGFVIEVGHVPEYEGSSLMAKENKTRRSLFACTACGFETAKWTGKCPGCGAWNTMEEHIEKPVAAGKAKPAPVGMCL